MPAAFRLRRQIFLLAQRLRTVHQATWPYNALTAQVRRRPLERIADSKGASGG
jgi:hypothetical protein